MADSTTETQAVLDKKISQLTLLEDLSGSEEIPCAIDGKNYRVRAESLGAKKYPLTLTSLADDGTPTFEEFTDNALLLEYIIEAKTKGQTISLNTNEVMGTMGVSETLESASILLVDSEGTNIGALVSFVESDAATGAMGYIELLVVNQEGGYMAMMIGGSFAPELADLTITKYSSANVSTTETYDGSRGKTIETPDPTKVAWKEEVYTKEETYSSDEVDQKIADLVDSAPSDLDTLNELAEALGDDPNFATTVNNKIAMKADKTYVDTELAEKADSTALTELSEEVENNYALKTEIPTGMTYNDTMASNAEPSFTPEWNTFYKLSDALTSLTLVKPSAPEKMDAEIIIMFVTSQTGATINIPKTFIWSNREAMTGDEILAVYELHIRWNWQSNMPVATYFCYPKYMKFEDTEVERICIENWSADGIGLTYADAEAVTDIGTKFRGNTEIVSFDELSAFTNVTHLKPEAFANCSLLETVNLTNVQRFDYGVFRNSGLHIVNAPSLTVIDKAAFKNSKVQEVVSLGAIAQVSGDWDEGDFLRCTELTKVTLPATVTSIGFHGFAYCTQLEEINLESVESVGPWAFANTSLSGKTLSLPNLISIDRSAFRGTKIIEISNLGSITALAPTWDEGQFQGCTELEKVTLPATITQITYSAFMNDTNLLTIICLAAAPPTIDGGSFQSSATIYVPDASVDAYKAADGWSTYADRIKGISELPTE